MGIHVEWVDAAATVIYAREGEIEDSYGTQNQLPAIVLQSDDAVVIEGTREELTRLAIRMLDIIPTR